MGPGEHWHNLFENWPEAIPRQGILVTTYGDQIPFVSYMIAGGLLLLERDQPDSLGARKVILSFDVITAIKMKTTIEMSRFQVMGFQPPF